MVAGHAMECHVFCLAYKNELLSFAETVIYLLYQYEKYTLAIMCVFDLESFTFPHSFVSHIKVNSTLLLYKKKSYCDVLFYGNLVYNFPSPRAW